MLNKRLPINRSQKNKGRNKVHYGVYNGPNKNPYNKLILPASV